MGNLLLSNEKYYLSYEIHSFFTSKTRWVVNFVDFHMGNVWLHRTRESVTRTCLQQKCIDTLKDQCEYLEIQQLLSTPRSYQDRTSDDERHSAKPHVRCAACEVSHDVVQQTITSSLLKRWFIFSTS